MKTIPMAVLSVVVLIAGSGWGLALAQEGTTALCTQPSLTARTLALSSESCDVPNAHYQQTARLQLACCNEAETLQEANRLASLDCDAVNERYLQQARANLSCASLPRIAVIH